MLRLSLLLSTTVTAWSAVLAGASPQPLYNGNSATLAVGRRTTAPIELYSFSDLDILTGNAIAVVMESILATGDLGTKSSADGMVIDFDDHTYSGADEYSGFDFEGDGSPGNMDAEIRNIFIGNCRRADGGGAAFRITNGARLTLRRSTIHNSNSLEGNQIGMAAFVGGQQAVLYLVNVEVELYDGSGDSVAEIFVDNVSPSELHVFSSCGENSFSEGAGALAGSYIGCSIDITDFEACGEDLFASTRSCTACPEETPHSCCGATEATECLAEPPGCTSFETDALCPLAPTLSPSEVPTTAPAPAPTTVPAPAPSTVPVPAPTSSPTILPTTRSPAAAPTPAPTMQCGPGQYMDTAAHTCVSCSSPGKYANTLTPPMGV